MCKYLFVISRLDLNIRKRTLQEDDVENEVMYSDIAHGNVNDDDDDDGAATALIEAEVCAHVMLFVCTCSLANSIRCMPA